MIVAMSKFELTALSDDRAALLNALQKTQLVEPVFPEEEEGEKPAEPRAGGRTVLEEKLARAQGAYGGEFIADRPKRAALRTVESLFFAVESVFFAVERAKNEVERGVFRVGQRARRVGCLLHAACVY